MTFHSILGALVIVASAALPGIGLAQAPPAESGTPATTDNKASGESVAPEPAAPAVSAPNRSVLMQAGDTRGASTGSSPAMPRPASKSRSRDEVRAEAEQAVLHHRATLSLDLDLLDGK